MAEIMEEFACEAPGSALNKADFAPQCTTAPGFQMAVNDLLKQ
jgi:hypothetical protein